MFTKEQIDMWIQIGYQGDNTNYNFHSLFKNKLVEAKMLVDRWGAAGTDFIFHSSHKDLVLDKLKDEIHISTGTLLTRMKDVKNIILNMDLDEQTRMEFEKTFQVIDLLDPQNLSDKDAKLLIDAESTEFLSVWGANIHFYDFVPADKGLYVCITNDTIEKMDNRSVVVFTM